VLRDLLQPVQNFEIANVIQGEWFGHTPFTVIRGRGDAQARREEDHLSAPIRLVVGSDWRFMRTEIVETAESLSKGHLQPWQLHHSRLHRWVSGDGSGALLR